MVGRRGRAWATFTSGRAASELLGESGRNRLRSSTPGTSLHSTALMTRMLKKLDAFARRGVKLHNERWSWGGVRDDGTLVLQVWADDFKKDDSGLWVVQIGYPDGDDPSVTNYERSRPGSRERERQIEEIKAGSRTDVELLVGHAVDPKASPRQTEGIDAGRVGIGGRLVEIGGGAWIECVGWRPLDRWVPKIG